MPKRSYGDISLTLPDAWKDASIVTLLPPSTPTFSLLSTKGVGEQQPNLVIRGQAFDGVPPDLEKFAKVQEQMMAQITDDLKVLDRGSLTLEASGINAVTRDYSFRSEPHYVRQLQVYFLGSKTLYIACGSGTASNTFDVLRKQYCELLNTIELA
jgi:hypothetical protein